MIKERTKRATLTFKRDELLYDCKNLGFVAGDVMAEERQDGKHQLQDIGEDGNVDWVTRVIGLALVYCTELLYPYSKTEIEDDNQFDDELRNIQEYHINLLLPDDFSWTTLHLLEHAIHMFVVYRVMYEWVSLVSPNDTQSRAHWKQMIEEWEEDMKSKLNARMGRARKTQTPF